jgi:hypothetical protein
LKLNSPVYNILQNKNNKTTFTLFLISTMGKCKTPNFLKGENWGLKMFSYLLKVTQLVNEIVEIQIRSYDSRTRAVFTSQGVTFPTYVILKV